METTDERREFNLQSEKGENRLFYILNNEGGVNVKTDEELLKVINLLAQFLKQEQEEKGRLLSLIERLTNSNK